MKIATASLAHVRELVREHAPHLTARELVEQTYFFGDNQGRPPADALES